MTRLIDADALNEKLCKTTIFIKDGEVFQRMINDAPTIEQSTGDLISRQDAIDAIPQTSVDLFENCRNCKLLDRAQVVAILESLPSAEPKTGKWMRLEREENVYDLHGVPTWGVNYMCDKCGFITTAIQDHFGQYKWCPSCGADMRGEEDADE